MRCSFCNKRIPEGTGTMYVKASGKIFYFCSSKCEKNMLKLKRKPTKVEWAQKGVKK
ncbi:50S ribosomal protein L24e [Candidatus Woesearchaeota archaeon]|nr:50S ribosomal protein L24e [Candidatus Woesearchaeota archaeon]RLE43263.1 MAG: 50S ribosomal protein L24e [Candidatus Woesearchaeota archaeon]